MNIEKVMQDMMRIAYLASKHQLEDEEKYGKEVAGLLRIARANIAMAFGDIGSVEESQAMLTRLHGQLQELINGLAKSQQP
jgi:hypothetical protein